MSNVTKHKFVSAKVDGSDTTLVRPVNWNDEHTFAGGNLGALLVRDTGATDGANWINSVASGQLLTSQGVGVLPSWSANPSITSLTTSGDITVGDQLLVSGVGPHAIGGATQANIQLRVIGPFFPSGGGNAVGLQLNPTLNTEVNLDSYVQQIAGTLAEAGSGTHLLFAGLKIEAPTITAGAAALTNAASLYIAAAPTGATNNYSLWIAGGNVRFDSTVISMTSATSINLGAATTIDVNSSLARVLTFANTDVGTLSLDISDGELRIQGDVSGAAARTTFTGNENTGTARSTGIGTIKFADATSRDNVGFIKIYIGTTARFIPVFAAN